MSLRYVNAALLSAVFLSAQSWYLRCPVSKFTCYFFKRYSKNAVSLKIIIKETAILKAFTLKIAILKTLQYQTAHYPQGHIQGDNTDAITDLPHPITPSDFLQFFDWRYLRPPFRTWRSTRLD